MPECAHCRREHTGRAATTAALEGRIPDYTRRFAETSDSSCIAGAAIHTSALNSRRRSYPLRGRSSQLWGGEAEHVAPSDLDHSVDTGGVRLGHAPESSFGQFNHPIIMGDEVQAGGRGEDGRAWLYLGSS
jgi:hypothetical protein